MTSSRTRQPGRSSLLDATHTDHVVAVEPPNIYRGPYLAGEKNLAG